MAANLMTLTKSHAIVVGNICSKCGNPVLRPVEIWASARSNLKWTDARTEAFLNTTLMQVINNQITRIIQTRNDCRSLGYPVGGNEQGASWTAEMKGIEKACPHCANVEPWQMKSPFKSDIEKLGQENFPIVYGDFKNAQGWVSNAVYQKALAIENDRKDLKKIDKAREEVIALCKEIAQLSYEKEALPELKRKAELEKEYILIKNETVNRFKVKKAIKEKAQILAMKIEDVEEFIKQKQSDIATQIIKKRNQLQDVQARAYGCTEQCIKEEQLGVVCYLVQPKTIPDTDMVSVNKIQRYCPVCGFELLTGSRFCSGCGEELK